MDYVKYLVDWRSVLPVSRMMTGEYGIDDVCLSIPSVIGIDGVETAIQMLTDEKKLEALQHSAETLKSQIKGIAI